MSDPVSGDLVHQVKELQEEVRYLRQRQESVIGRLPATEVSMRGESLELSTVAFGPGEFESSHKSHSLKTCDLKCSCYRCQYPLAEAPCIDCPRVSTLNPYFNVHIFGAIKLDMLLN